MGSVRRWIFASNSNLIAFTTLCDDLCREHLRYKSNGTVKGVESVLVTDAGAS
jgi:hypothetical protein